MSASKFSTVVKVAVGGTAYDIDPAKRPTGDPMQEDGGITAAIRNTAVSGGEITSIQIPLEMIVGPTALRGVIETLENYLKLDMEVLKVHGRIVVLRDKRRSTLPSICHLATALIFCPSTARVCDEFNVRRKSYAGADKYMPGCDLLYVRLLTAAQCEAASAAEHLDEMFNAQFPSDFSNSAEMLLSWSATVAEALVEEYESPKAAQKPTAQQKKKAIPEGAATWVMRTVGGAEALGDTEVDIDKLVQTTAKAMPPQYDKEGKNRSKKYIRAAIDKLVDLEFLELVGDSSVRST